MGNHRRNFLGRQILAIVRGHRDQSVVGQEEQRPPGIECDLRAGLVGHARALAEAAREGIAGGAEDLVVVGELVGGDGDGVAERGGDAVFPKIPAHVEAHDVVLGAIVEDQAVDQAGADPGDAAGVADSEGDISGQVRGVFGVAGLVVDIVDAVAVDERARPDTALDEATESTEEATVECDAALVATGAQDGEVVFDCAGANRRQAGAGAAVVDQPRQVHVDRQRRHV